MTLYQFEILSKYSHVHQKMYVNRHQTTPTMCHRDSTPISSIGIHFFIIFLDRNDDEKEKSVTSQLYHLNLRKFENTCLMKIEQKEGNTFDFELECRIS